MTIIAKLLQHDHNKQLSDYNLQGLVTPAIENLLHDESEMYTKDYMEEYIKFAEDKIKSNPEMMAVVNYFFENEGAKVFVSGGAGRGKTVLLEYINCKYRLEHPQAICQVTCSTGCQTEEYKSANTVHTGYQVGIIHLFRIYISTFHFSFTFNYLYCLHLIYHQYYRLPKFFRKIQIQKFERKK
jgi:hypothetical protein